MEAANEEGINESDQMGGHDHTCQFPLGASFLNFNYVCS